MRFIPERKNWHTKKAKVIEEMGKCVVNLITFTQSLLGAGVRHSAHGKGHEEGGGSTYAKAGSSLRSPPWKSSSIYPHNQSLPTLLLCALAYTSDLTGGCPPPPLSEKELT